MVISSSSFSGKYFYFLRFREFLSLGIEIKATVLVEGARDNRADDQRIDQENGGRASSESESSCSCGTDDGRKVGEQNVNRDAARGESVRKDDVGDNTKNLQSGTGRDRNSGNQSDTRGASGGQQDKLTSRGNAGTRGRCVGTSQGECRARGNSCRNSRSSNGGREAARVLDEDRVTRTGAQARA
jgi:hypothetical protein